MQIDIEVEESSSEGDDEPDGSLPSSGEWDTEDKEALLDVLEAEKRGDIKDSTEESPVAHIKDVQQPEKSISEHLSSKDQENGVQWAGDETPAAGSEDLTQPEKSMSEQPPSEDQDWPKDGVTEVSGTGCGDSNPVGFSVVAS